MNTAMVVGLLAVMGLIGCASSGTTQGMKRAEKTAEGMDKFVESLNAAQAQIDQTVTSMNAIGPAADRVEALKTFNKDVATLESMADKARKRANAMRQRGAEYFETWLAQSQAISNPDLRAVADERRSKLEDHFAQIKASSDTVKDNFESMMENIYDIQLFLGTDLTDASVEAIKPYAKNATTHAQEVNQALGEMIEQVGEVRKLLEPGSGSAEAETAPAS
jgi:methyl-accepting chemotaxis protein